MRCLDLLPRPCVVSQCTSKQCCSFQIVLNSMHKYQPRVLLSKKSYSGGGDPLPSSASTPSAISGDNIASGVTSGATSGSCSTADEECPTAFVFPETVFIAVTAYQNQLVSARNDHHIHISI